MRHFSLDIQEQEKSRDELMQGLEVHNGIAIPHHMTPPGQDGYRTPNVHDYEWEKDQTAEPARSDSAERRQSKQTAETPPPPAGRFSRHLPLVNLSKIDLKLERLHWRERVRHCMIPYHTHMFHSR